MFNIGPPELVVMASIALIFFGPKTLPELVETFRHRMTVTADRGRWTLSEWALVVAMVGMASVAVASLLTPSRGL